MAGRRTRSEKREGWAALDDIALFDAIAKHRPTGPHKHLMMVMIQKEMEQHTGEPQFSVQQIWDRLNKYYDIGELDESLPWLTADEFTPFELPESITSASSPKDNKDGKDSKASKKRRDSGGGSQPSTATKRSTRKNAQSTPINAADSPAVSTRRKRFVSPAPSPTETKRRR